MSVDALGDALRGDVLKLVEALKAEGATAIWAYGACLKAWKPGDEIQLAVDGVDDDHLLKVTGRIMMNLRISTDLCHADDAGSPFAAQGKAGVKVL